MATLGIAGDGARGSVAFAQLEFFLGRLRSHHIALLLHHFQMLVLMLLVQVVAVQGSVWLVERQSELMLYRCEVLRLPDDAQVGLAHRIDLGCHRRLLLILFKVVESGVAGDRPVATRDALLHEALRVMVPASPAARKRVLACSTGI